MAIINKHFWKISVEFLGIVAFSIGILFVLEYWRDYQNEEELRTLMNEIDQKGYENYEPASTSTLDVVD